MLGRTAKANKRVQFGYGLNYLIDIEYAVIVDVEATPARTYDEVAATKTMIKRTEETLGLKPGRLVADTAYGTGKFLGWLVGTGITPHIPVWDKSDREDGTFSGSDFTFDRERNVYICPAGKLLKTTGNVGSDHMVRYRALKRECGACPLKPQCSQTRPCAMSNATSTRMPAIMRVPSGTPEFDSARDERKKVEMRFAHLKTHLALSVCGCGASPAHATSSTSRPSCKPEDPGKTYLAAETSRACRLHCMSGCRVQPPLAVERHRQSHRCR